MVLKPPAEIDDLLRLIEQSKLSLLATAKATPVLSALTSLEKETSGLIIVGPEGVNFTEEMIVHSIMLVIKCLLSAHETLLRKKQV
ncbi:hypothetical protein RIF29_34017 [Crotalaria pallida]|uniref:Uncharacterized protein n=1 Tax=Crotalaria pallida TaxID=3830 RepID=A0AAN9E8H1_CROPI